MEILSENSVNDEILDIIANCVNNCECNNFGELCQCKATQVVSFVQNRVLFVNCSNNWCNYYMHFGNSTICNSPKRIEIYKKYKK